jgi:predicted nucleic acid-binding protein
MGHHAARNFVEMLERSPRTRVIFVGEVIEDEALRWLLRHDEKAYSFVDATSFLVMRDTGIREALTFDADFAAAGFSIVS